MSCIIVNLETGRPTADAAMLRLSQEVRMAKAYGLRTLKIIHGYGSTGKGGAIRRAARQLLRDRQSCGQIKGYVTGEEFSPFSNAGRAAVATAPELRKDCDFGRDNLGVTIVLL